MDGNGRWARRRSLPRTAGHTEGEENLASVVRLAVQRDVGWLTVFGFSTENWVRPRVEVRHILGLHKKLFGRVAELNDLNVRVQWIGRPFDSPEARTPRYVQKAITKAIADTGDNTGCPSSSVKTDRRVCPGICCVCEEAWQMRQLSVCRRKWGCSTSS